MIESRCGIVCTECEYSRKMNCGGCVHIEKPFWGDTCPVKHCCESKGLLHCGACGDFPCNLLNQFAYDKEQGDNGQRIEQCREWAVVNVNKPKPECIDKKYACYCGLYCENCSVKVKVEPAANVLYKEMKKAGFEEVISFIPGGEGFWSFLKSMANNGMCVSCRDGNGGNPACAVRICAKEKNIEMCAFCEDYPCDKFTAFLNVSDGYPVLKHDNALLRDKGWNAWAELQAKRREAGFTYSEEKRKQQ